MKRAYRRWLAGAAFVAAAALPVGNADAVVYTSTFDPPNFNGTATFDVSQACLDIGDGTIANGTGGCTVQWLTAVINITVSPAVTFDYSHLLPSLFHVTDVFISGGELEGVRSSILGPRLLISGPRAGEAYWIQFEMDPPSDGLITALDGPPSSGSLGFGVVYMYQGTCEGEFELVCTFDPNDFATANVEGFQRVPEPGSLALLLAACAAAWSARRRRVAA